MKFEKNPIIKMDFETTFLETAFDEDEYLRFKRMRNEPFLDSLIDVKQLRVQYTWLENMWQTNPEFCKRIVFQGPGIASIVRQDNRDYMRFMEVVHAFNLYTDAMFRYTYHPLDMTTLDHAICGLIECFCKHNLASDAYTKWYATDSGLRRL